MSDPCPPAFIRTAPPIDPGTPTAHSNPVSPAAADRRATTGRKRRAAGHHVMAFDGDRRERVAEADDEPAEPGIGHQQVRPLPEHEHRHRAPSASPRPPPTGRRRTRPRRTGRPCRRRGRSSSAPMATSRRSRGPPQGQFGRRRRRRASPAAADDCDRRRRAGTVMSPAPSVRHRSPGRSSADEPREHVARAAGSQATRFHG